MVSHLLLTGALNSSSISTSKTLKFKPVNFGIRVDTAVKSYYLSLSIYLYIYNRGIESCRCDEGYVLNLYGLFVGALFIVFFYL